MYEFEFQFKDIEVAIFNRIEVEQGDSLGETKTVDSWGFLYCVPDIKKDGGGILLARNPVKNTQKRIECKTKVELKAAFNEFINTVVGEYKQSGKLIYRGRINKWNLIAVTKHFGPISFCEN